VSLSSAERKNLALWQVGQHRGIGPQAFDSICFKADQPKIVMAWRGRLDAEKDARRGGRLRGRLLIFENLIAFLK
jgi:hypothetical protein